VILNKIVLDLIATSLTQTIPESLRPYRRTQKGEARLRGLTRTSALCDRCDVAPPPPTHAYFHIPVSWLGRMIGIVCESKYIDLRPAIISRAGLHHAHIHIKVSVMLSVVCSHHVDPVQIAYPSILYVLPK